jgi:UDP-N-acetylmuramoyl-tripeptide--D-alanyl-D-alanine ligase
MAKVNPLIQWWFTPKLPSEHIFMAKDKKPEGLKPILRVYSRKWLLHPLKRRIARSYLKILQEFFGLTVIGITGSVGKTSTKEMIVSVLSQQGETMATYKNIDPIYNIPTTILKCRPQTKYLVLEMGVEFIGEMDFYLWLAKPSIGVITNIHPTHTFYLKSVKGVEKEKAKLVQALSKEGYAVLNSEDRRLRKLSASLKARVVWYGPKGNIKAENLGFSKEMRIKYILSLAKGKIDVQLPIAGRQFVKNSLAAAEVANICGLTLRQIRNGLEGFSPPEHRMEVLELKSGTIILDDSYNNNPAAAKEALRTLKEVAGKKKTIVVFGDMLELGRYEKRYHQELGIFISRLPVDYLIGVGQATRILIEEASKRMKKRCFWVQNYREVMPILRPLLKINSIVLVKGSRSISLDKVVSRLS